MKPRIAIYFLIGGSILLPLLWQGCQQKTQAQPTAPDRRELLEFAFASAETLPLDPHHKDRARAQQQVVEGCIASKLPEQGLQYARKIRNWRRGAAIAELAIYHARIGQAAQSKQLQIEARQIADLHNGWRRDEILVRLMRARGILQDREAATELLGEFSEPEAAGQVAATVGLITQDQTPMQAAESLRGQIASAAEKRLFDLTRNLLFSAARLLEEHYSDADLRVYLAESIEQGMAAGRIPIFIRIELLLELSETASAAGDSEAASEWMTKAQTLKDGSRWPLRFGIGITARLAEGWQGAGQAEKADALFAASLNQFNDNLEKIQNFDRAEILRTIAESLVDSGRAAQAREVYSQAVEQGAVNPNLRPRAEDLVATAVSMATTGVLPDRSLWSRMRQIRESLGDR
ncbi:MAG: hypothetical protein ACLFUJ_16485 [Phycisphaerae bacterium]